MINVLLVDDQTLVRQGINSLLGLSDSIDVVAQANDGLHAIEIILSNAVNVEIILMDIRMPNLDGIQTLLKLNELSITIPVIMLTTFDDHQSVIKAIQAGAKGYLLKDVSLETLVDAIETVNAGETLIQPAITERLIQGLRGIKGDFEASDMPETLSNRETEILRLMGVRDRTRAVLKAIELGII